MEFFDTHCHIHEARPLAADTFVKDKWAEAGITNSGDVIKNAVDAGVTRLICVGNTLADSKTAIQLAAESSNCWASVGVHPHEAKDHVDSESHEMLDQFAKKPRVVAIGECGLDYYYNHSTKRDQQRMLRIQLEVALKRDLPLIFHIREAFTDFWKIFDEYKGLTGVVHSFSATLVELEQALSRGLYIGLNGIMTFTKSEAQLDAARAVPSNRLVLETDAPFLTPTPYRGTICEPKHVVATAKFLAELRSEELSTLANVTTLNAKRLFKV